ncbi:Putative tartrate transporter [Moorella thermoacetica]|uniref:Putative tartrate transporter n=1 Tax=Neomoorella thermoacetica TaxID=1525 RepID=A0A1J5NXH4_NEOTH|nr:MFS transporter [Moorella thermoacetica]OIQ09506.1 putative tartrate transporter [Moorella thermoacetica]OIQ11851.1 putative tartrate transporter [Moorella thermoacetica]OIQ62888.1 putative tartrate transporter [Moorella thermoacetica]
MNKIPNGRWIHIIPATILVYIVAFMDRTNISFAIAGGMDKALGMTASISGLAAGIFFVGYLFLQVPGGHIAEHGSAKKFIAWTIVFWGGAAILTGFITNTWQLLAIRFILGVAEGGVYPAILTILSHWFPSEERARANAYFQMNVAIASIITGPFSGLIIQAFGWREVFIIEGLISLVLIFVWLPLVSDHPRDAKWITKEEREYIERKLAEEQALFKKNEVGKASYKEIFSNINMWKLIGIYFAMQVGFYGFSLWLPTLLKQITKTGMGMVGFLSIFPYVMTIIGQYIFAQLCDRTMNRKLYTALPILGFAICLTLAIITKSNIWLSYSFMVLCGTFLQAATGPFWTMPPALFSAEVAGGARGVINALGNLGGFIGPYLVGFITTAVNQNVAIYTLVGFLVAGALLTFSLPTQVGGLRIAKEKLNLTTS